MRKTLIIHRKQLKMTQQQMADYLNIGLRYYQSLEKGDKTGDFKIWDKLEDLTGVHQRQLREISKIHPDQRGSQ